MSTRLLWAFCLFFSCNTSQQPGQNLDEAGDTTTQEGPLSIDRATPFFIHLEGVVGDYLIGMELRHFPGLYATGSGYQGYYYYQKYGEPIALYGSEEEPGLISLTESDVEGNATGVFRGRLSEAGLFEGEWASGDGKRTLSFKLKPSEDLPLVFDLLVFSDSLAIATGAAEAPRALVTQSWLYPKAGRDAELIHFLRSEIRKNMAGDSLASLSPDPPAAFNAIRKGHFEEFRSEIESLLAYQREHPEEESWMMNYDFSREVEIYYLSPTLLTLGFSEYSYTGGAHGNYGTSLYSYDLADKKALALEDVFKPGYEDAVGRLLAAKAREAYGLTPSQPLSEVFFQDEIGPTENFGLTDKGVFFLYNPYEIAAYAVGQIQLFIPFEDVSGWVKRR